MCPARTTANADGLCVADIIKVDPNNNVTKGKFYCDYGDPDPKATQEFTGSGCVEVEYESQCDKDWGELVKSCKAADRRKDIIYCDFGPENEYGGGCYWILSEKDCDKDWGIVEKTCGKHIAWDGGTICPSGEGKNTLSDMGYNCRPPFDPASKYCDYGKPYIDEESGNVYGDCWPISTQTDRDECIKYGTGVQKCPATYTCPAGTSRPSAGAACEKTGSNPNPTPTPSGKYCYYGTATNCYKIGSSGASEATEAKCEESNGKVVQDCNNVVLEYCDWGQPDITGKGCWAIRNATDLQNCITNGSKVSVCPNYTCPAGTTKANVGEWGSQSACVTE